MLSISPGAISDDGASVVASLRDLISIGLRHRSSEGDANLPDEAFKRQVGPELARVGNVIAIFDNEPGNCNVLQESFPNAYSILVDTQHLPGAPPLLPTVKVVRDFQR
jgi:hypothetical protein